MNKVKTTYYVIFYVMSIALIATLWIPYFVEEKRIDDLNERFYSDLNDEYSEEYKRNEPFGFNPGFTTNDTLPALNDTIEYYAVFSELDTDGDNIPDSLDLDPLKHDSTIVIVDDKRVTFKSVSQYIGDLASSFNKVVTLIISLINIPVAYNHYKEKKKEKK